MNRLDGLEVLVPTDTGVLEAWLEGHHATASGVWLMLAKKGSGVTSMTSEEVIDVALCFGWIDGQRRAYDAVHFLQKITPRRPRSLWSLVNVRKVDALTAAGRMREPGLAEVRAAQEDGRWAAAYPSQKEATVPPDLEAALAASPEARDFYDSLGKTDRYLVILRLVTARTAENRAERLTRMVAKLAAGQKIS
ncbi:YdeI/OmpD-associated family protein [Streptomyces purpureus]|nr:YdeI/OmpD-associated family protein [Streptomyces purpureus]